MQEKQVTILTSHPLYIYRYSTMNVHSNKAMGLISSSKQPMQYVNGRHPVDK